MHGRSAPRILSGDGGTDAAQGGGGGVARLGRGLHTLKGWKLPERNDWMG